MLWIAYEPPAMNTCLAMHLSVREQFYSVTTSSSSCRGGGGGMAESQYSHTDGARCYNEACSGWLRLCRYVYGTELKKKKNLM
ncbi:MAG TPA: hypothetical protein VNI77_09440 [Nitrososphaera sp.]|nr:hypothetical protein [Nitrososphaera sp.]